MKRVLVKISGEALQGTASSGLDAGVLAAIAADIKSCREAGYDIAIVVGGGNFFRGVAGAKGGIDRVRGDFIGMLATVMNAIAVEGALDANGVPARAMSAIAMPTHCETYERNAALRHLAEGRVVVLGGGGASAFFTTDTTAAIRAAELGCDAILKATNVDGVYSADPKVDPAAERFDVITHEEALRRNLKVMDATAFALARETRMPIIVFSIHAPGAISAALSGKGKATRVVP